MEETKKPWFSKTLILNLVMALSALVFPQVGEWVSANPDTMVFVWAGVNAVLRFVTKDKIQLT